MFDQYSAKEEVLKIISDPFKSKSSYGNWAVRADAHFTNSLDKEWNVPGKTYYFWTKARALGFIEEVNNAINNGRKILV